MNIINKLSQLIDIDGLSSSQVEELIVTINEADKGDYTIPCFKLSKQMRLSPQVIATTVASKIVTGGLISKVEAVNGYINIFVSNVEVCSQIINETLSNIDKLGTSDIGAGKTICIDYSSVNIAKTFHIGHLGTTAIGSSLYKIYSSLGYNVVGINHLGDYGTQFGKMIVAYKLWGDKARIDAEGVNALQDIYVRFHQEEENNPDLTKQARDWFVRIENNDKEAIELFEYFKRITLSEVSKMYDRLSVKFDSWNGESFFNDKMQAPLELLKQKGLLVMSEGAEVVDLAEYNMPPCLLVKADGATLYATRDIAAAMYRKQTYDFDKCLYVVAYQQNLHFKQFFKVLELAEQDWSKDLVHVAYGMVSLEDGAMSTRKGNVVKLIDVLDKAVEKASLVISSKNPNLANKEEVAEQVGVGAVIFSAVANGRIKDVTFSFDRILSFEGETSPYIQYTNARCNSLIEKAGVSYLARVMHDFTSLDNDNAKRLCLMLNKFNEIIIDASVKYEPSIISKYLIDTCQLFNKFYNESRIIDGDNIASQNAKLDLVKVTSAILTKGLNLLGIQSPTSM